MKTFRNLLILFFTINFYATDLNYKSSFFNKSYKDYIIKNANDLSLYLLETANVALVTGNAFGSPNCVRISYASSIESLQIAVSRIADSLNKLK